MINSCGNLHGKCEVVCNAANELESAADDLSSCAKNMIILTTAGGVIVM